MGSGLIHLHLHSNYSLLCGANTIEQFLARAKRLGMDSLALTDTNCLYGAVHFYKKAKLAGIKPIVGTEIEHSGRRAVCLARDAAGYVSLCRIVTARRLDPRFFLADVLTEHRQGLYILSDTFDLLEELRDKIPADRLYAELIYRPDPLGKRRLREFYARAKALRLPFVATNDVYFCEPEDYEVHRVLTAIRLNTSLAQLPEAELAHRDAYLKSGDELARYFHKLPEAVENTRRIAADCNLELRLGEPIFPKFHLPEGETPCSYLRKICLEGVRRRYHPLRPEVMDRLRYELEVINKLGFAEYFLIVWDIVRFARDKDIPIVGRGSAADSLVSYVLGITEVDPIKYDLYFERFLNLSRTDCPDIDLDICWRRRDTVINYVYEKYGADRVAMVCTYNTFQARSAFRDVAKTFGLPLGEINRLTSRLPYHNAHNIRQAIESFPECRDFPIREEPYRSIVEITEKIDEYTRHLGIHNGGVVISDGPMTDLVPLEHATKGLVVTQYDMGPIEDLGLIKIDLLGHRALSVIADTIETLRRRGIEIDLGTLSDGDEKTAGLLQRGLTLGCFQIESPGMRNLLQMMRAKTREDTIVALSLIRPGPASSGMKAHYVRRLMGLENVPYLHPRFNSLLKDTYGVMLYQEDILKIAHGVADFTLEEADELRKAISKKRSKSSLEAQRDRFIRGALRNGVPQKTAQRIWDLVVNFAGYSYCKAHATTYGYIAYQATYLKAHYPAELLASVLSNQAGFYEPRVYLEEARRMGVRVLLPDVNHSGRPYTGRNGEIRVGLMQVRDLTQKALSSLLQARREGPFTSLVDFCLRVDIGYPEVENLILCGVMDCLDGSRPELLWKLQAIFDTIQKVKAEGDEEGLFRGEKLITEPVIPSIPDYQKEDKLRLEQEILGLHVTDHPLSAYDEYLKDVRLTASTDMGNHVARQVIVCGWLVAARRVVTKTNQYMKFITLEDRHGLIEVVLFPKTYQQYGHLVRGYGPYLVNGLVQSQNGSLTVTATALSVVPDTSNTMRNPEPLPLTSPP